jgi:8-oxo-dGTP pyrophosphatase MutT (NUDIX family)
MAKALIFGSPEPNIQYIERRAAYVVIINDCKVAMVKSRQTHFLPGGGSLPGEAPEDTVIREVKQQLIQPDKSPESGRLEYVFQITYLLTPPGRRCFPSDCVTDLTRT